MVIPVMSVRRLERMVIIGQDFDCEDGVIIGGVWAGLFGVDSIDLW
jgi:hypothetical protein